jgi:AraC family transcriptional regulator of adaptative response / DNA-3-methyladenine glycosylase II
VLAQANLAELGLSERRARILHALACAVADGRIAFDRVIDLDGFLRRMRDISGMDDWTAQYIAMRALGEPDAFPVDRRHLPPNFDSNLALSRYAEAWRPWRAYAAVYLGAGGVASGGIVDRKAKAPSCLSSASRRAYTAKNERDPQDRRSRAVQAH